QIKKKHVQMITAVDRGSITARDGARPSVHLSSPFKERSTTVRRWALTRLPSTACRISTSGREAPLILRQDSGWMLLAQWRESRISGGRAPPLTTWDPSENCNRALPTSASSSALTVS
ncbi:hypothetical protein PENTCL1PPCAC_28655, partial [Pristionchus entomophagus]